jgi:hypothetical protein
MKGDSELATRYRQRAGELREIAKALPEESQKKTLNDVAADYEQMGRVMDELASSGGRRAPPFSDEVSPN